jgi:hypothetical protein
MTMNETFFFVLFSKVVNLVFHLLLYSATNRQSQSFK